MTQDDSFFDPFSVPESEQDCPDAGLTAFEYNRRLSDVPDALTDPSDEHEKARYIRNWKRYFITPILEACRDRTYQQAENLMLTYGITRTPLLTDDNMEAFISIDPPTADTVEDWLRAVAPFCQPKPVVVPEELDSPRFVPVHTILESLERLEAGLAEVRKRLDRLDTPDRGVETRCDVLNEYLPLLACLDIMGYDLLNQRLVLGLRAEAKDDEWAMRLWSEPNLHETLEKLYGARLSVGWYADQYILMTGPGRWKDLEEAGWLDGLPAFLEAAHDGLPTFLSVDERRARDDVGL